MTSSVSLPVGSAHFDPACEGTPDSLWQAALAEEPRLTLPPATRLVVVSPHPDDETLGAGGLIRVAGQIGCEVIVVSVTNGEAAFPTWEGLDTVRREELGHAMNELTPHKVSIQRLRIPDGRVDQHRARLFAAVDRWVSPGALLVGPYESDGHPDHEAAGLVCREIAELRAITLWRYPIWAWHHRTPHDFAGAAWGRVMLDSPARQAKDRAIHCFKSQIRPLGREPIVPTHVLTYFGRPFEAFLI